MPAAIVAGKALVTFALPSGAMMCVAAAEPSLGRRAANVLLCRRAASSQLLKGEPVLVSRSVPCVCVTSRSMHPMARQSLHPAVVLGFALGVYQGCPTQSNMDCLSMCYRAPEPSDIRWEHIQQRGWRRFLKLLPAAAAALVVCGVSLGFQFGFAAAATRHTSTGCLPISRFASALANCRRFPLSVFLVALHGMIRLAAYNAIGSLR